MNRVVKFRGLELMTGDWVHGSHLKTGTGMEYIVPQNLIANHLPQYGVDKDTVGQFTGLHDKNNVKIYEGDITELELVGETRRFVARIKTVIREVVSHPSFEDDTARVAITGVVFEWEGFELFPCVDENGKSDVDDMIVIGNIYEHPELLEIAK